MSPNTSINIGPPLRGALSCCMDKLIKEVATYYGEGTFREGKKYFLPTISIFNLRTIENWHREIAFRILEVSKEIAEVYYVYSLALTKRWGRPGKEEYEIKNYYVIGGSSTHPPERIIVNSSFGSFELKLDRIIVGRKLQNIPPSPKDRDVYGDRGVFSVIERFWRPKGKLDPFNYARFDIFGVSAVYDKKDKWKLTGDHFLA